MIPKSSPYQLRITDSLVLNQNGPHVLYANLNFGEPKLPRRARRLLRWLHLRGPSGWTETRTLRFLEKHQSDFRECLAWLSSDADVDFGVESDQEDSFDEECELRKSWEKHPQVRFLQLHGIDHGGIALIPGFQEFSYFHGLQLDQKKPHDPLDPICWYLLSLLASSGSVGVRRCLYWKCGKFFSPRTSRKRFCSDSCRALNHVGEMDLEMDDKEKKKMRERRREYMQRYRGNPIVKGRTPKS